MSMTITKQARQMARECTATHVRQASRVFSRILDEALRPLRLQSSQLPVLCAVATAGEAGASISVLARGLAMDPTTLTRNIRPLERAGLLRVARAPEDARTRTVFLTGEGGRMIRRMFPLWQRGMKVLRSRFGAAQLKELSDLVAVVRAGADGGDLDRLYLTQFVYVKDGEEGTFQAFEDIAIPLMSKYRGQLLVRMRPNPESIISAGIEVPYEIHVVRFESEDDFQRYSQDEERTRALHLKDASVRSAILMKGTAR